MQPALLRAKIGLQPTPRARTQLMTNVVDRALIVEDETPPIPIVPVTAEAEIPFILADLTAGRHVVGSLEDCSQLHQNMAEEWRRQIIQLRDALTENRCDPVAREAVRSMVEEISVISALSRP